MKRALRISCGSLGKLRLSPGFYVYVGFAMGGLSARLSRHHRRRKLLHWHIDHLLHAAGTRRLRSLPIRSRWRLECPLAGRVASLADGFVPRFGSSDCRCPSHLFFFRREPLERKGFRRLTAQRCSTEKRAIVGFTRRSKSA